MWCIYPFLHSKDKLDRSKTFQYLPTRVSDIQDWGLNDVDRTHCEFVLTDAQVHIDFGFGKACNQFSMFLSLMVL